MTKLVQEKFEVREPENRNDDPRGGWVTDKSARKERRPIRGGSQGEHLVMRRPGMHGGNSLNTPLNYLPPGMNIEDQENSDIREMGVNSGGGMGDELAGGDRTQDINRRSLREGFDRKPLRPTDDMYSREHNDAFYDEVEVDGVVGFVERNNYCDRS
jgi:hypothetical protein